MSKTAARSSANITAGRPAPTPRTTVANNVGLVRVNVLEAHHMRFRVSWKRSGILLIHGGVVAMMLGEVVTGLFAVESKMTVAIGETVDFVDVAGKVELAYIDSSDAKNDHVT